MAYSLKLKEARKAAHLTQKELCDRTGIALGTYRAWEQGAASKVPISDVFTIAEVLGTDVNALCGWYDTHPRKIAPELTKEESMLVTNFRACDKKHRDSALVTVSALAESSEESEIDSSLSEAAEVV